jgi:serine/threonine protein kinase
VSDYLSTLQNKLEDEEEDLALRLLSWARQVATGMRFVQEQGVVHGDLALRNVLLTDDCVAKISDFGLARDENVTVSVKAGMLPVYWLPPECFLEEEVVAVPKDDSWAFGITMWELFTLGRDPYRGLNSVGRWLRDGNRMDPPAMAPEVVRGVMYSCWRADPSERPRFREVVEVLSRSRSRSSRADSGIGDDHHHRVGSCRNSGSVGYAPLRAAEEEVCYWNGYKIIKGGQQQNCIV